MVVLADELLESFFDTDFSTSFQLQPVVSAPMSQPGNGLLGGLLSSIVTDDNIKMFHKLTDEFGKTIGQHHVGKIRSNALSLLIMSRWFIDHRSEEWIVK